MNTAAGMTQSLFKKNLFRGALLLAAIAACDSGAPTGEPKDDPTGGNQDIVEALNQLPEATVLMYSADGVPQYIVGDLGKIDPSQMDSLIASDARLRPSLTPILKAFRLSNDNLELRKINTDDDGGRHFRYTQTFNGLPVVGGDLVVHVDVKGGIVGVNGTARGDIPMTLGATGTVSLAAANSKIASDARFAGMSVTGSRTVYLMGQDGAMFKAYEQIVEGKRGKDPVRDKVFVSVDNGEIVAVHPQIMHARNRLTYSANNGTTLPGTLKRTETQAATGDTAVDKAHDSTATVYDAFKWLANRDSIDNAGMNLVSSVHYSTNYCNAFWNSSQMTYGDGNSSQGCAPLANSLDVAGHEIGHGITERESGLVYSGESGGLNESYSDIFGAFTEAYRLGGNNGTLSLDPKVFLIGDEVLPPALRYMCDPAADGVSKDVWSSSIGSVDVHYSSGPNNLAFCLLVKGGTHPRGKTTNNVPALGFDKTIRIFYKANVDILTSSSNYAAMRTAMENAATQLGYDAATKDAVSCAYAAIAVGTAPTSCGGTPPPPPPGDTVLSNGVAVSASDSTVDNIKFYKLTVPAGQSNLTFQLSGGTGDADLYVNFGAHPSLSVYTCRPYLSGNNETCTITNPAAGDWYVGLHAYAAYSGASLKGTYSAGGANCGLGGTVMTNGVAKTGLSGASGSNTNFCLPAVPAGKTLTVKLTGPGTGDADLYTRQGALPTTSTYACRPYLSGNTETCTHSTTTAGDWYFMLRGFSAYTGVSLVGSY